MKCENCKCAKILKIISQMNALISLVTTVGHYIYLRNELQSVVYIRDH